MKRARVSNLKDAVYLSPDNIRFSQDTISATFSNGKPIGKTLDALVKMEIFVPEIPPICVAKENGTLYTRNNRRLWVFKQLAAMNRCNFIPCFKAPYVPKGQFTTVIGGHEIIVRGDHQSETLEEFTIQKRREMLNRIRSRQITADDKPRGYFTPRFEYMRVQKRRKVTARKKLQPKPEDVKKTSQKKEKGVNDNLSKEKRDTDNIRSIKIRKLMEDKYTAEKLSDEKLDSNDEIKPAKVRKLMNVSCKLEKQSDENQYCYDAKLPCNKGSKEPLKIKNTSQKEEAEGFDFKKYSSSRVVTNFTEVKDLDGKEGGGKVVIDLTDDDKETSCKVDVELHDKENKNDVFKFSAKRKDRYVPGSQNYKSHKIKTVSCRSYTQRRGNRQNHLQYNRGGDRVGASVKYPRSEFSNGQNPKYHSNKLVQSQPTFLVPIPLESNFISQLEERMYFQNNEQNSVALSRHEYNPSDWGPQFQYGQLGIPVMYGQGPNVSDTNDFQMFCHYRH